MDKYTELRAKHTNGINYDLDTEAVIAQLQIWDHQYGIELSDINHDQVVVTFQQLPDNIEALAHDIYAFCPDIIDQHFGCFDEMIASSEELGQAIPAEVQTFVAGVDFSDENYGLELLKRSLQQTKTAALWWD